MSTQSPTLDRRAAVDIAAAAIMVWLTFSWGLNGVAAKLSNQGFNPLFVSMARSAIGGVLVFIWCHYRGIKLFERDGTLIPGIIAGALFGIEFILIFVGLDFTSVARSTLMVNTMPFWVLIGAHFLLGEKMSLAKFGGLALAFCGVALVFSDKLSLPGPDAIIGDIMSIAAGVAWALTTLVIKRSKLQTAAPEKLLLYQLVVGCLLTAPLIPLAGAAIREWAAIPTAALLFQAIYIVAFTYVVWFWIMRRYPAAGLSSFAFLTPVFGVLCGGLFLGEPLSVKLFAALALIAAGLIIVNRPTRAVTGS
ncbi:MAG TPA: DMT family transporter [Rhizobiaceae bacterium]|nr:DMT family transporter [Rhizobiaceae bacterium]